MAKRYADILLEARVFAAGYAVPGRYKVEIDRLALICAVQSAYDDIERYKLYHLQKPTTERSDAVKRSAYLTKWLVKRRPFFILYDEPETFENDGLSLFPNEMFALNFCLKHMFVEKKKKRRLLKEEAYFGLMYDLHFRQVTEDGLLAVYQMLYDQISHGPQFEN